SRRVRGGTEPPCSELLRVTRESSREAGEVATWPPSRRRHRCTGGCRGQVTARQWRADGLICQGGTNGGDHRGAHVDPRRTGRESPRCIRNTAQRPSLRGRV